MKFLYPGCGSSAMYGVLASPGYGVLADILGGKPWAGDIGALEGPSYVKRMVRTKALRWAKAMLPYVKSCLFLAGYDVVEDARRTLEAYAEFEICFPGWPLAYVAQNGAEYLPIPASCAAVFIGGNTSWKESLEAVSVIKRAQAMGKHIHIGRVNWYARYKRFQVLAGAEHFTCDGTRPRFDGRDNTVRSWLAYESQPALVEI